MSKGVLYKANASTWTKSQAKKFSASTITDGRITHANATTWFDNYPMEQEYTKTFVATWSQGWRGDGVRLDDTAWYNHVLVGSTTNFRGMYGFDRNAITDFCTGSKIQKARFHVYCYETTTNGSPDVKVGKHIFSSEPSGTWTGANSSLYDYSTFHVPNGATGGYWVTLNPSQIRWNNEYIGGITLQGIDATNENHGKFRSASSFRTELEITVLK